MTRVLSLVLLLIASTNVAVAADPTPDSMSSQFFETLIKGDGNKAIDGFLGTNPMMKEKTQQLQLLKSQLGTAIQI